VAALTTVVGALLKRTYDNVVHDGLNSRDDLMGRIPKEYAGDGQEFYTVHRTNGTNSMRFQAETSQLPLTEFQSWTNSVVTPKEWWGTLALSVRLIMQSKTNPGAFLEGFNSEVYGFSNDVKRFMEIRLVGDGSGCMAKITSITEATNTVIVDDIADLRKLRKGQSLEVWTELDNDSAAVLHTYNAGGGTLLTVNTFAVGTTSFTTVEDITTGGTIASTPTAAAGDPIVHAGARTAQTPFEPMGILGAVSDRDPPMHSGAHNSATGGLQQILAPLDFDGSTQTGEQTWAATVFGNSGTLRPISDKLLQQACDAVEISSNGMVDVCIAGYGTRLEYMVGTSNIRRATNTNVTAARSGTGFSENSKVEQFAQFGDIELIPNRYWPADKVACMTWNQHCLRFWAKHQWWDDGQILRRSPQNKTEYQAEQFALYNYVMKERNAHSRIDDVTNNEIAVI